MMVIWLCFCLCFNCFIELSASPHILRSWYMTNLIGSDRVEGKCINNFKLSYNQRHWREIPDLLHCLVQWRHGVISHGAPIGELGSLPTTHTLKQIQTICSHDLSAAFHTYLSSCSDRSRYSDIRTSRIMVILVTRKTEYPKWRPLLVK